MRDLFQISCMLDKFSTLGRPLFLTSLCVPGRSTPRSARSIRRQSSIRSLAGKWKRPWDPELQAEWLSAAYRVALSKPYIESIAWGNLADISSHAPRRRPARRHAKTQTRLRQAPGNMAAIPPLAAGCELTYSGATSRRKLRRIMIVSGNPDCHICYPPRLQILKPLLTSKPGQPAMRGDWLTDSTPTPPPRLNSPPFPTSAKEAAGDRFEFPQSL